MCDVNSIIGVCVKLPVFLNTSIDFLFVLNSHVLPIFSFQFAFFVVTFRYITTLPPAVPNVILVTVCIEESYVSRTLGTVLVDFRPLVPGLQATFYFV